MFLHANVVRVKEGKNNKTFSDKRKPFKWQGKKRRFGEAFIKGKKVHICAPHTTYRVAQQWSYNPKLYK